jgi:type I restriction enzyme S subunit
MNVRQGYRQRAEIGEIPEDWKALSLESTLSLCDSGTWGVANGTPEEGTPILRSTNIQGGKIVLDGVAFRVVPSDEIDRYRLAPGDILVTRSSGSPELVGGLAYFDLQQERTFLFSNYTQRLRGNELVNPKFLFYYLSSPFARRLVKKLFDTTSGLKNLDIGAYKKQLIPVPPLEQQEKIASILSSIDEAIHKTEERKMRLEQLKRGLMQTLLTGKVRVKVD